MITTLTGVVAEKLQDMVVLDVQGVGYGLFTTDEDASQLVDGVSGRLYVHEHIREQSHDLYGFLARSNRELFELLLGVNGVGPKMALSILNVGPADGLRRAIAIGDHKYMQAAAGVGQRVAERVVVDLKDKIGALPASPGGESGTDQLSTDEAREALVSLGYTPLDAAKILSKIDADLPAEERIKLALKKN